MERNIASYLADDQNRGVRLEDGDLSSLEVRAKDTKGAEVALKQLAICSVIVNLPISVICVVDCAAYTGTTMW